MRYRSLILFLCVLHNSFSQNPQIDSMLALLKTKPADSVLINTYNELNWEAFNESMYDTAIYFVNKAIQLEEIVLATAKPGSKLYQYAKERQGTSYMYRAGTWLTLSNFPQALKDNRLAYETFKEINDKEGMANSLFGIGGVYKGMGNFPEALSNHFAALKIREELKDKMAIAASYNNIGSIYKAQLDYDKSLQYMLKSLALKKEMGDRRGMGNSYNNIANIYAARQNYKEALKNHLIALEIRTAVSDRRGIALSNENIGNLYASKGELERSLGYYNIALDIYKQINDKSGIATILLSLCHVYTKLNRPQEAEKVGLEGIAIAQQIAELESVKLGYENLSLLYEHTGDHKKSLHYYKNFIAVRDSMLNEDNTKKSIQAEMQYEFDKKEAATKLEQEKKEAIAEAEKKKARIVLLAISGFGLLVLGFALFAWRSFLQKRKANLEISLQKELIEEKQKEILDSIYYARRIQRSLMPHEKYIQKNLKRLLS